MVVSLGSPAKNNPRADIIRAAVPLVTYIENFKHVFRVFMDAYFLITLARRQAPIQVKNYLKFGTNIIIKTPLIAKLPIRKLHMVFHFDILASTDQKTTPNLDHVI